MSLAPSIEPIPDDLLEWIDLDSRTSEIPEERRRSFQYLVDNWRELRLRFAGEYVAAAQGAVKAHGSSWVKVYLALRDGGISWDVAAVRYIPRLDESAELLGCS